MQRNEPPNLARVLVPLAALTVLVLAVTVSWWVIPIAIVAALALSPALLAWWRRADTGIVGVEEPSPTARSGD